MSDEVRVLSERELGEWRLERGEGVVKSGDRWWMTSRRGLYQPVHLMARLRADEVRPPAKGCWGYWAPVVDEDARLANASMHVNVADVAEGYDESAVSKKRLRQLKRCRNRAEVRRVGDPTPFLERGYQVFVSAYERTRYGVMLPRETYDERMAKSVADPRAVYVAAFIEGELVGYTWGFAVDGTGYVHETVLASDGMKADAGTGMRFELMRLYGACPEVQRVVAGSHTPGNKGLDDLKRSLGYNVAEVPTICRIPAAVLAYLKWRRPGTYYFFTGKMPKGLAPEGEAGESDAETGTDRAAS